MTEKVEVEMGGQSKYQIAHVIALNIIHQIQQKKLAQVTRKEYLQAVSDAIVVLNGGSP